MIPDSDVMTELAKRMETACNKEGWDRHSILGIAFDVEDSVCAIPAPWQPSVAFPGSDRRGLTMIADSLTDGSADHRRMVEQADATGGGDIIVGVWFMFEAWGLPKTLRQEGRRNADIPGAVEMRCCVLVDCAGRLHFVSRVRGGEQGSDVREPGWTGMGEVAEQLRRILLALGASMSPGMVDLAALRGVGQ